MATLSSEVTAALDALHAGKDSVDLHTALWGVATAICLALAEVRDAVAPPVP